MMGVNSLFITTLDKFIYLVKRCEKIFILYWMHKPKMVCQNKTVQPHIYAHACKDNRSRPSCWLQTKQKLQGAWAHIWLGTHIGLLPAETPAWNLNQHTVQTHRNTVLFQWSLSSSKHFSKVNLCRTHHRGHGSNVCISQCMPDFTRDEPERVDWDRVDHRSIWSIRCVVQEF